MPNQKYIVARWPNAGIGDHLSCLLGSWWYAKQTGRALIIDWRGSRFNAALGRNCFFDFFKPIQEIDGVPVFAGDNIEELFGTGPYFYPKWTREKLEGIEHVGHTPDDIKDLYNLILSGEDRPEPVVVANQHLPLPRDKKHLTKALEFLQFQDRFSESANSFIDDIAGSNPVVGVHIRHGNGENIGSRAKYWLDPYDLYQQIRRNQTVSIHRKGIHGTYRDNTPSSLTKERQNTFVEKLLYRKIRNKFNQISQITGISPHLLLFTDAEQVVDGLKKVIPSVIRYDSQLLPTGAGPLHQPSATIKHNDQQQVDPAHVQSMFTELALLQRCSCLIYIPSQFTILLQAVLPEKQLFTLKPTTINRVITKLTSFNK